MTTIDRSGSSIEKITISGNYTISRAEILNIARLKDTVLNAEEINIDNIQDRISKNPEIKKVFVSKELPSELKIEIIERRPVPEGPIWKFYKGLYIGLDQWDKTDFFYPHGSTWAVITTRVAECLKKNKITNLRMQSLADIEDSVRD